jgi:hypothetical protein
MSLLEKLITLASDLPKDENGFYDIEHPSLYRDDKNHPWHKTAADLSKKQRGNLQDASNDELEAYGKYLDSSHEFNVPMWTGENLGPHFDRHSDNLDKLINRNEAHEPLTVFRGVQPSRHMKPYEVGKTYHKRAFTSTTLDPAVAADFTSTAGGHLLQMKIPAGHKGRYVSNHEDEFLLPRDVHFKVTHIKHNVDIPSAYGAVGKHTVTHVMGELVPKPENDEHVVESRVKKVDPTLSKLSVDYGPGMKASHCGVCISYVHGGRCRRVKGKIESDHWCRKFKKRIDPRI